MSHLEDSLASVSRIPLSLMKDSVSSFLPSYWDTTLFRRTHLLGEAYIVDVGSYVMICHLALAISFWHFEKREWSIPLWCHHFFWWFPPMPCDSCVRSVEAHPSAELGLEEARDAVWWPSEWNHHWHWECSIWGPKPSILKSESCSKDAEELELQRGLIYICQWCDRLSNYQPPE